MNRRMREDAELSPLTRAVLDAVQSGFPLEADPYAALAVRVGAGADAVYGAVVALRRAGIVRRIGATFSATALGLRSTLAAARVDAARLEAAAARAGAWPEVTHNYERPAAFNLWFTVVARDGERLNAVLEDVRAVPGVDALLSLPAVHTFKLRVVFRFGEGAAPDTAAPASEGDSAAGAFVPDAVDRRLIPRLGGDLGEGRRPLLDLARALDLDAAVVIERARGYLQRGIARRIGAVLRHRAAGVSANGMAVWDVPDREAARLGAALAARPEVSHCYERLRGADWPFNVYGMIHGRTQDAVQAVAADVAARESAPVYRVLFSRREFKKTSLPLAELWGGGTKPGRAGGVRSRPRGPAPRVHRPQARGAPRPRAAGRGV